MFKWFWTIFSLGAPDLNSNSFALQANSSETEFLRPERERKYRRRLFNVLRKTWT